ncbi:MAG: ACP S-malonyltransferase [Lentisphaeria bacterium]|nr:ACP S-malonyltransferase [Lentisphaeria bacterium]
MKAFFVFSGQGAQSVGMGKDLYEAFPEARRCFDATAELLGAEHLEVIFAGPAEKLTSSRFCQTAIYTMSCAALEAFRARHPEVVPVACAGLSLGEYAALYAAGAFDYATGLKLLARRAELMDAACRKSTGGMASVLKADPAVIEAACAEADIDVANYNSPGQIVISGEKSKLAKAIGILRDKGVTRIVELNVAGAFHSRLMAEAGEAFAPALEAARLTMPRVPVYHNYTAATAKDTAELRSNLARQVSGSVRWEGCLRAAVAAGADTVIEFGPGNVLTGLAKRTIPELRLVNINSAAALDTFQNQC